MLSLSEAQAAISADVRATDDTEEVALAQARGRYLAQEIRARTDHPPFDNSAMDGYALKAADVGPERALTLHGVSSCGSRPAELADKTAMRIFTGAPLPHGADTVVIQEDTRLESGRVVLPAEVRAGEHVRRRGGDFKNEDLLYARGARIRSYDIAVLAAAGYAQIRVYRRPRVLVIATGDELIAAPQTLQPGQVYESNRLATLSLLQEAGADAIDGGMVADNLDALTAMLAQTQNYDFVITSGGASVGDRDLARQAFAAHGDIKFWKVRIKPGKPVAFGRYGIKTHFFALPGNPVSSLVTFKLFVEPALAAWHRGTFVQFELPVRAGNDFARAPGRMEFLRAQLYVDSGTWYARALARQGSHMIGALRETNGFIRLAEDAVGFARGDIVSAIPLFT